MAYSAFGGKTNEPREPELKLVLGEAGEFWDQLISGIRSAYDPVSEDWVWSGKKWGSALRLKHKKRAVLYMTPSEGFFHAGFALGKKAVNAAQDSDLSEKILKIIDGAQVYAEGRAVRLDIHSGRDVSDVVEIAKIKMSN